MRTKVKIKHVWKAFKKKFGPTLVNINLFVDGSGSLFSERELPPLADWCTLEEALEVIEKFNETPYL